MPELNFITFVYSLVSSAAIHLGDMPDPNTGQTAPRNLAGAQQMIDILAILDTKTRGNLTAEERQFLEQSLYELRLRYVSVSGTAGAPPVAGTESTEPTGA